MQFVTCVHQGTDLNDKVRGNLNTPALMKMLNTSEAGDLVTTSKLEDSSITPLETPLSNQDKMMLETPLRLSLTLECDMYESDVMLDTLSDTSTWCHPARRRSWLLSQETSRRRSRTRPSPRKNWWNQPNLGAYSKQVYLWILPLVHKIQLFL